MPVKADEIDGGIISGPKSPRLVRMRNPANEGHARQHVDAVEAVIRK